MRLGNLILASILSAAGLTVMAREPLETIRPVTAVYTAEIGSSHLSDTYLTPLHYDGIGMALNYERWQAMRFNPEHWVMNLSGRLSAGRDRNPARNATMWGADLRLSWAMLHRWSIPAVQGLKIAAGGMTELDLGVLYLMRNSNNPASVKASWTVGVTAQATWATRIGRLPVTVGYRPSMPLAGVFFSPDYDELYYEIYLGNHSGLAHFAWPGNFRRIDQLLSIDLKFGATALRLGYRCNLLSTKVSNLVTHDISHMFIIGISGEWISLNPRRMPAPDARYISAY